MAGDGVTAFWRDDAKLWIHSRGERLKVLLVALIGLVSLAIGVYVLGKSVSLPRDASAILSGAVTIVTALAVFSLDLYFKGGNAGSDLTKAHVAALAQKDVSYQEQLTAAHAAYEEATKSKTRPGNRSDVIKRFQRLVDDGLQIAPQSSADFERWESKMIPVVQECFDDHWAREIIEEPAHERRIQDASDKERAKRRLTGSIARLQGWIGNLRDSDRFDHCIRDFSVPIAP